jgi:hypothetical protein
MDELARLDKIRGPRFKSAITSNANKPDGTSYGGAQRRPTPQRNVMKQPLSEAYHPKELKMRPNPLTPGKSARWSYKFPNGRIIYLSSACTKCGGKHFNFECKKDGREPRTVARAAFMQLDSAWDESVEMDNEDSDPLEDDEMEVAYAAYMGTDPWEQPYGYLTEPTGQRQIAAEPWSEGTQKKEN